MKHHVKVGKPAKGGKLTDVESIATNQLHNYQRRGYVVVPDEDFSPSTAKASKKASSKKASSKKTAAEKADK